MTTYKSVKYNISGADLTGLTASQIPNLDTAKITTGTLADARISASSVSQHATSFDDNDIVNDLSTIALRSATTENAIAYNTNSSFVDVFQDSSGIASFTTSARDTGEFVSSQVLGSLVANTNIATAIGGGNIVEDNNAVAHSQDGLATNQTAYTTNSSTSGFQTFDWGSSKLIHTLDLGKKKANGDATSITVSYSTDNSTYTPVNLVNTTQTTVNYNGSQPALSNFTSSGTADWAVHSGNQDSVILKLTGFTQFTARYLKYTANSAVWGDANLSYTQAKTYTQGYNVGATGNFISNVITAPSSTSKMGAIITYQDNAGTNTLNTDIILQLSADNGSNWSTATLSALPNYSTGIKMAKVNDLAVTAGTQLKYKISFANQSSGSKEARIRGVSLQY
jgi:hypothetical protein